jgi:uncharacterized protein (DUF1697 family)
VFQTARRNGESLERFLEKETEKCFKKSIDYVVRNAAECDSVVARNPFPEAAALTPGHLLVFFLKQAPEREGVRTLETRIRAVNGPEVIHADNKQLYIMYPEGIGTSKLTGAVIEKSLGVRGTARNWNTVLKFTALSHSND